MDKEISELYGRLKGYLRKFLGRPQDIEDVVQDSFLKTLEAAAKGDIHYPSSYLYTTARNLAINKLTRNYYELFDFIEHFPEDTSFLESASLEDEAIYSERLVLFCRVASQLPDQCRKVLILRKVYGYSQKEVAEQLGISVSTVEKHLVKGMLRCTEFMERQDATFDVEAEQWTNR